MKKLLPILLLVLITFALGAREDVQTSNIDAEAGIEFGVDLDQGSTGFRTHFGIDFDILLSPRIKTKADDVPVYGYLEVEGLTADFMMGESPFNDGYHIYYDTGKGNQETDSKSDKPDGLELEMRDILGNITLMLEDVNLTASLYVYDFVFSFISTPEIGIFAEEGIYSAKVNKLMNAYGEHKITKRYNGDHEELWLESDNSSYDIGTWMGKRRNGFSVEYSTNMFGIEAQITSQSGWRAEKTDNTETNLFTDKGESASELGVKDTGMENGYYAGLNFDLWGVENLSLSAHYAVAFGQDNAAISAYHGSYRMGFGAVASYTLFDAIEPLVGIDMGIGTNDSEEDSWGFGESLPFSTTVGIRYRWEGTSYSTPQNPVFKGQDVHAGVTLAAKYLSDFKDLENSHNLHLNLSTWEDTTGGLVPNLGWGFAFEAKNVISEVDPFFAWQAYLGYEIIEMITPWVGATMELEHEQFGLDNKLWIKAGVEFSEIVPNMSAAVSYNSHNILNNGADAPIAGEIVMSCTITY